METEKRLIDANALKEKAEPEEVTGEGIVYVQDIDEAPTVDSVEVVRCRDCIHHKLPAVLTQKYGEPGTLTCHNWHSPCNKRNVKQDDFCSYGERKYND